MSKKEKSYIIKVPVYCTEMIEKPKDIFGGITYDDLLNFLKHKIKSFNEITKSLSFENRNKTKKTVISGINYTEHACGETDALLLRISAYSTNLYDGYLEAEEKIEFKNHYKLGSETNFIMIYPVIKGLDINHYVTYFIVLVYEDPTKTNAEISKITKVALSKILEIPVANIKLPTIMEEVRKSKMIPELHIKYSAIYNQENDVDIKYRAYLISGKIKKQRYDDFKNIPVDKMEDLLYETDNEYQRKETKLVIGKKEYRISKERLEAEAELKETAEKIFNASTSISQAELDNEIHKENFVFSKLQPILENYLSCDYES